MSHQVTFAQSLYFCYCRGDIACDVRKKEKNRNRWSNKVEYCVQRNLKSKVFKFFFISLHCLSRYKWPASVTAERPLTRFSLLKRGLLCQIPLTMSLDQLRKVLLGFPYLVRLFLANYAHIDHVILRYKCCLNRFSYKQEVLLKSVVVKAFMSRGCILSISFVFAFGKRNFDLFSKRFYQKMVNTI